MSESGPVGHKGISRKHLKIYYSFDNQGFEMKVLGRNGAFLNEVHYLPEHDAVELHDGDKIQIGAVAIMFRLPNAPADDDAHSESSDSISGGISLNFEDGRGQSIVPDDESDDDGFSYAEHYDFSPHAYGWDSEEEDFSADDDAEDEYRENEHLPKVKLKLKLKQPAQQATTKDSKAEARLKKKKKKEKLKAKKEAKVKAKAAGKSTPKAQSTVQPEEVFKDKGKEKENEKEKEKEREREKEKKEKKEKTASKTATKTASKTASKTTSKAPSKTVDKPKEKTEPASQVSIVPPEDVPQPSTEISQPEIKTEGGKDKDEKKLEIQANKDSSGRRVLTAEEAEKLGLEPGTVIERKKGPGRPPKDGIMSKREKAEIMRRKKEAEKARKLGLDPESITKVDLTRPREKKDGEGKSEKKPKSEGAEGESAGPDGEGQGAEKKSVKISRPLRTPSPEMKESDYTEEQLQRPAANYVVLIHEAISNSKEGKLNLQQIYSAIERKYPYYKFKTGTTGWQSSVRHNLGQHDAFRKAEKEGKGWLKPNLYSDSAPYATMLNNFRDYYIRNAHAMLKRKLTRDEIVKLTDRGLERALYPERYPQKEEETDENAKLDLKDEKDIEDAVKGMLKKFNFGYLVEEAESRVAASEWFR
ncbi:Forkhead domain-containing protein [Neofusicoccum parvum]|uniref:Forkhead domain-containing protein n=1 Tax=Neofusicoccum parvum TaxID=310453 RepID=A0ACB5RZ00_9PEZI|nr:Forkhead domain-containing protein [Neofusicoccum parvum]